MLIRGMFLIMFALFIDFLQFALGWVAFAIGAGLQSITPVGGAIAGAAAGGYACFSSAGGIVQGIVDAGKCAFAGGVFGALASTFGIPFGSALGFMLDICLSLTLGSGLIFLLAINGMFYSKYVWSGGIFELMPGFDVLPAWTVMVVLCLMQKRAEEGKAGIVTTAAKMVSVAGATSVTNPSAAMQTVTAFEQAPNRIKSDIRPAISNQGSRAPLNLKSPRMADIKPHVPKAA